MIIEKICLHCNIKFESDKRQRRKFCSQSCAASFNNKYRNRKATHIKICLHCQKSFLSKTLRQKFCSHKCSTDNISKIAYDKILNGTGKGSYACKKYILQEQNHRCDICEMSNIWNNQEIIFILDHIDGNSENNNRKNLRLICPNCDSQLPTYKAKNKGNGRYYRLQRRLNGKSF